MTFLQSKKWSFAAIVVAAISCKGDSLEPGGDVASVVIAPRTATVAVGASVHLSAEALDASGKALEGRRMAWASSNRTIATVSNDGIVTGVAVGTVQIAASTEGKSAIAEISVNPTPVASVRLTPTNRDLLVGQAVQLSAQPVDADGAALANRPVTFTSSNASVASVSSLGVVTALAPGSTIITATSEGKNAVATIGVASVPVAVVAVAPTASSLVVGQTTQLKAEPRDASGQILARPVVWSTSAPGVATVSSTGLVIAIAPGEATISAVSEGKTGTATITVSPKPVSAVIVSPGQASVIVGQTVTLTGQVTDEQGNVLPGRPISFSSGTPSVATVTGSGVVTGISAGTATITATSEGKTGTATITVAPIPVARVSVSPAEPNVIVGQTVQLNVAAEAANGQPLTGRTPTWTSGAPGVASVSNAGLVTALSPGTAVIFASIDGVIGTATVTVRQVPVATVVVTPPTSSIVVGGSTQLSASVRDASGAELPGRLVGWTSSDDAVAIVSSTGANTGRVTALKTGTVTITASSEGKSGTATVTVTVAPVATVSVTPPTASLTVGQTVTLTPETRDAGGNVLTGRPVTWSTSNAAVATVTQGVVTAVGPGTATITATSEGKTGTATITVSAVPVATVTVAPGTLPLQVGQTGTLTATTRDAANNVLTGRDINWSTSNAAVATVAQGVVTATGPGTATITAASEGKTGTATVTVTAVPVATVSVTPLTVSLTTGGTQQVTATPRDAQGNALARPVTWQSANTNVATVQGGVITAVGPGSTTVTAASEGKTGTVTVTVTPPAIASVTVAPSTATVNVAATTTLTATVRDVNGAVVPSAQVMWSSDKPLMASVTQAGVVTGLLPGTATITAAFGGKSGTATITVVLAPVGTVTVTPSTLNLRDRDNQRTGQLTATIRDALGNILTGRQVTWSSSNTSVASVSPTTGPTTTVTANDRGSATITAASEGKTGTASVTVTN